MKEKSSSDFCHEALRGSIQMSCFLISKLSSLAHRSLLPSCWNHSFELHKLWAALSRMIFQPWLANLSYPVCPELSPCPYKYSHQLARVKYPWILVIVPFLASTQFPYTSSLKPWWIWRTETVWEIYTVSAGSVGQHNIGVTPQSPLTHTHTETYVTFGQSSSNITLLLPLPVFRANRETCSSLPLSSEYARGFWEGSVANTKLQLVTESSWRRQLEWYADNKWGPAWRMPAELHKEWALITKRKSQHIYQDRKGIFHVIHPGRSEPTSIMTYGRRDAMLLCCTVVGQSLSRKVLHLYNGSNNLLLTLNWWEHEKSPCKSKVLV